MDKYERLDQDHRVHYNYRHKETGKVVAVKTLRMQTSDDFGIQCMTLRKISLLKEIDHDNVARLLDIICDERLGSVHLILEYADLDLRSLIKLNPVRATDQRFIRTTLEQILHGLYCYHSIDGAHGNLNPTNMLVDCTNRTVKLIDLDAVIIPSYKAPELLFDQSTEITPASDMFSVGCIFAEMITQKPLFNASSEYHEIISLSRVMGNFDCYAAEPPQENRHAPEDLETKLNLSSFSDKTERDRIKRNLERITPDFRPSGIDLLSRMLCSNPRRRITVEQALKHPYIKSGDRMALG